MSKQLRLVALVLVFMGVFASSPAHAQVSCDGNRLRCEGSAQLTEDSFKLDLIHCGAPPTIALKYKPAGRDPEPAKSDITCAPDPHPAPAGAVYICDAKPLKGLTKGSLIMTAPTCAVGNVVADVGAPAERAPNAPAPAGNANRQGGGASGTSDGPSPRVLPESSWQRVLKDLGVPVAKKRAGNYYDSGADVAVLFFDADGDAYYPMLDVIDEDDDIYVVIADYSSRLAQTSVSFTGCNRPPLEPRVYGNIAEAATVTEAQEPIDYIVRPLGKCAGSDTGGPQVIVKRNNAQQAQTIPVNPLYRFAVGVAAAYDGTRQREFFLNTLPGETVPRIAESREIIGLTSLVYISFYPSARDFRKTDAVWQRTQLFVGLDPRAFDKHLVVGVGYELTMGLNALVGWRIITREHVLSEGSGLSPGMTFDGDSRDLPTRERWERGGVFLGVGLSSSLLSRLK